MTPPGIRQYVLNIGTKTLNFKKLILRDCDFEKKDLDDYSSGMGMGGFMPGGTDMGPRGPEPRQGDWDCPKCQNINFSHRNRCNGKSSGVPCNLRKPEFEKFSVPFLRNKEMRQPGDWCCLRYLVSRIVKICFLHSIQVLK